MLLLPLRAPFSLLSATDCLLTPHRCLQFFPLAPTSELGSEGAVAISISNRSNACNAGIHGSRAVTRDYERSRRPKLRI